MNYTQFTSHFDKIRTRTRLLMSFIVVTLSLGWGVSHYLKADAVALELVMKAAPGRLVRLTGERSVGTSFNPAPVSMARAAVQTNCPVRNTTSGTTFSTIQAAITAATAGDVIDVCAGTFSENIVINKSLTLRGANAGVKATGSVRGAGESIIDGTGGGSTFVVHIQADNVTIDGFSINPRVNPAN